MLNAPLPLPLPAPPPAGAAVDVAVATAAAAAAVSGPPTAQPTTRDSTVAPGAGAEDAAGAPLTGWAGGYFSFDMPAARSASAWVYCSCATSFSLQEEGAEAAMGGGKVVLSASGKA